MEGDRRTRVRALAAEEQWTEAKELLETSPDAERDIEWVALAAEIEAGLGQHERALELYQRVLDERPRHPAALYNRALVLVDIGQFEEAVSDLEELVEVEGELEDTLAVLAEAYLGAEFYVPAWLCARRWEALAEENGARWSARTIAARALDAMGRRDDARALLDEAILLSREACEERDAAIAYREELS
ncbi:MAG: tetratricopeptide repeat protein [Myxococcales bacterium]|nr:tetratricopeptide repeat protein [Myxococcales bacterium]